MVYGAYQLAHAVPPVATVAGVTTAAATAAAATAKANAAGAPVTNAVSLTPQLWLWLTLPFLLLKPAHSTGRSGSQHSLEHASDEAEERQRREHFENSSRGRRTNRP